MTIGGRFMDDGQAGRRGKGGGMGGAGATSCALLLAMALLYLGACSGSGGMGSRDARTDSCEARDAASDALETRDGTIDGDPAGDSGERSDTTGAADVPDTNGTGDAPDATDTTDAPDASDIFDVPSPIDVVQPSTGLLWVPGRSFPMFASIDTLDVVDASQASTEQNLLLASLQGLVNRTKPRIYVLRNQDSEGGRFWLDPLGVTTRDAADPMALVLSYREEIPGLIVYDPAMPDTINLATALAGIDGGIVASPDLAATLSVAPYELPVLTDLRTNGFGSAIQVYQYELDHVAARATTRLLVGLPYGIADCLRDYAVATGAAVIWLDPTQPAQEAVLRGFLQRLDSNAPYLGWWTSEPVGVRLTSTYGVPTYAADYSRNLTVFGGRPIDIVPPAPPATPTLQDKVYVAIFMSDGDNLQEDQHLIPLKWADPARGSVPISWTVQPGLVDAAPVMLDRFWKTASANDVLVSGPSGLGYTYPRWWPLDRLAEYTRRTADAMSRGGLRVITVWNDGPPLEGDAAHLYRTNLSGLLGVTDQFILGLLTVLDGSLPQLQFSASYANDAATLQDGIQSRVDGWDRTGPLFVAVQGNMNSPDIHPTAFAAVRDHFAADPDVVFVRGDHLFRLIRESLGLD